MRPSTQCTHSGDPHPLLALTVIICRSYWSHRVEIVLLCAPLGVLGTLPYLVGAHLANDVFLVTWVALIAWRPSRLWLARLLSRSRFRRRFAQAVAACGLPGVGERVARFKIVSKDRLGWVVDVVVLPGATVTALQRGEEALAAALRVHSVRVESSRSKAANARLHIFFVNPLSTGPLSWPWTKRASVLAWEPVPLGVSDDGTEVRIPLFGHHLLIGGEPGGGKSVALSCLLAALVLDPEVDLYGFDAKLVELSMWSASTTALVGPDVAEATRMLSTIRQQMESRYTSLLARKLRKVPPGGDDHIIAVVIDELALYLTGGDKKLCGAFAEALRDLVARGRAAGVVVIAATQRPSTDVVPSSLRDLFGFRLAMRCSTRDASDTVLGAGWASLGYSAADIDASSRGEGWLLAEGGLPRRLKGYWLSDSEIEEIARRAALQRSQWRRGPR